jgi:hypothetical protein
MRMAGAARRPRRAFVTIESRAAGGARRRARNAGRARSGRTEIERLGLLRSGTVLRAEFMRSTMLRSSWAARRPKRSVAHMATR